MLPVLGAIGILLLLGAFAKTRPGVSTVIELAKDKIDFAGMNPEAVQFAMAVKLAAAQAGVLIRYVSGKRSCAQQNKLYAQGRTAPGPIVTDARGCRSWHVQGRAVDFEILSADKSKRAYAVVGSIAKEMGGKWGGDFPRSDPGHIEYHPGLTIEQVCPDPDAC